MAVLADIRNMYKNNQKKALRTSTATVKITDTGTITSGDSVMLFTLPADCVVFNAHCVVVKAPTGGTQTVKVEVGGTDAMGAVAVGTTVGAVKTGTLTKVHTGTGANVLLTVGVANLTDGEFEIGICYAETTRTIGEFTTV